MREVSWMSAVGAGLLVTGLVLAFLGWREAVAVVLSGIGFAVLAQRDE